MEVIEQGLVNHIALVRAMRTAFAQRLFIDLANGNARSSIRPGVFYYGLSQGAIMAPAVMAYRADDHARRARGRCRRTTPNCSTGRRLTKSAASSPALIPDALDIAMAVGCSRCDGQGRGFRVATACWPEPRPRVRPSRSSCRSRSRSGGPQPRLYWQARTMGIPILNPDADHAPGAWQPTRSAHRQRDGDHGRRRAASAGREPPAGDYGMHNLTRRQPPRAGRSSSSSRRPDRQTSAPAPASARAAPATDARCVPARRGVECAAASWFGKLHEVDTLTTGDRSLAAVWRLLVGRDAIQLSGASHILVLLGPLAACGVEHPTTAPTDAVARATCTGRRADPVEALHVVPPGRRPSRRSR